MVCDSIYYSTKLIVILAKAGLCSYIRITFKLIKETSISNHQMPNQVGHDVQQRVLCHLPQKRLRNNQPFTRHSRDLSQLIREELILNHHTTLL